MNALSPQRLLALWETGARYQAADRSLLLFALAEPSLDPDTLADLPLSHRNASILHWRCAHFGNPFMVWIDCPQCVSRMEMQMDVRQLPPAPNVTTNQPINIEGALFRRPTTRDLVRLNSAQDANQAAQEWLRLCAPDPGSLPTDAGGLSTWFERFDEALEAQDPWASLAMSATCPDCSHEFVAELDVADLLWDELGAQAQHTLSDVHTLASAYGWSEEAILQMSAVRRGAYLERLAS
jgi:hypothetical protein